MRTFEIKDGSIDVRVNQETERVCLVFEGRGADVRLFRTMDRDEAAAFHAHLGRVIQDGQAAK